MKNILFSLFLAILLPLGMMAQSVTLTFTGKDANNNRVQLNCVSITNLTKGWQETIYWPDTTLTMQNGTGIDDYANNGGFALSQNNPNPFNGTTDVLLTVADAGTVTLEIADVNGRIVVGANDYSPQQSQSGTRGNTTNPFNFGDMMEYVGYATFEGEEYESVLISQPQGPIELAFELSFPSFHLSIVPLLTRERGWILSDITCPTGYGDNGVTDIYTLLEGMGGYECDDVMFFHSDGNEYVNYGNLRYDYEPSGSQFIGTWTLILTYVPAY